jgi:DHA2 family methylenomycin A resistance protein-like MFS transporter
VIGEVFKINLTHLQWVNNSFLLAMTCVTLLAGYFADVYGRKKVYLIGIFIFTAGSLMASVAVNASMIVIGRSLQGLGIGISFPLALILIGESFPEHLRGTAMGLLSTFAGVSQGIGPTIGGVIVQWLGWRWAFIINLPICPLVIWIIWRKCLVGLNEGGRRYTLDIISVGLLLSGLITLLTALNQMHQWGLSSNVFLITFGIGIVLLVLLFIRQGRISNPLIDLSVFKFRAYTAITIIRPIFQFIFFGFYFVLPLYLQNFLGYSPTQTGLIILLMSIMMGILAPLVGRYIDRVGVRPPLIFANSCVIFSFAIFTLTGARLSFWVMGAGLMALGVATGTMFPTSNFTAVHSLPEEKRGLGMGIFSALGGIMASLGIAVSGAILSELSRAHYNHLAGQSGLPLIDDQQMELRNMLSGAHPMHLSGPVLTLAQHSFLSAYHMVMMIYVLLAIIALYFCRYLSINVRPDVSINK